MTDHRRWQVLAATAMDFQLDFDERQELDRHLHDCVDCRQYASGFREDAQLLRTLDFGFAPAGIRNRLVAASGVEVATSPSAVLLFIGAILLILATFGAAIGVGSLVNERDDLLPPSGNVIHWQTAFVDIQASDFWIDIAGERFYFNGGTEATVVSDRTGSFEVAWREGDHRVQIQAFFIADGADWQLLQVSALAARRNDPSGQDVAGAAFEVDPLELRQRVGLPFVGEVALVPMKGDDPGAGTLHFGTLRITVANIADANPNGQIARPPLAKPVPAPGVLAVDPQIEPVSLSNPGDASAAIEACHVNEFAELVTGMGRLPSARLVTRYAGMTSTRDEPAWLVLFGGPIEVGGQPFESGICLTFDDGQTLVPLVADATVQPILAMPPLLP